MIGGGGGGVGAAVAEEEEEASLFGPSFSAQERRAKAAFGSSENRRQLPYINSSRTKDLSSTSVVPFMSTASRCPSARPPPGSRSSSAPPPLASSSSPQTAPSDTAPCCTWRNLLLVEV